MDTVAISNDKRTPHIVVSSASLWSLVEYLSLVRVHADYCYEGKGFRVAFPHHDDAGVRQIVRDWEIYSQGLCEDFHEAAVSGPRLQGALR